MIDRRLQDDIDAYVADAGEQYLDLLDAMAVLGDDFSRAAWRASYEGSTSAERRGCKVVLFCFTTLVNDVNELLVRARRIAEGTAGREPMAVVYERLRRERLLTAVLERRLASINRARNRMTHVYGLVSAAEAHGAITAYVTTVHAELLRRLARWLAERGYRLV